jgi:hypothetical protein
MLWGLCSYVGLDIDPKPSAAGMDRDTEQKPLLRGNRHFW